MKTTLSPDLAEELQEVIYRVTANLPPMRRLNNRFRAFIRNARIASLVHFYYLPLFALSSFNGKTLPALKILIEKKAEGKLKKGTTIVGATSGNTGVGWAYLARLFGVTFWAVIERKVPKGKQIQLELAGAKIKYAPEGMSAIEYARILGKRRGFLELNQYTDWGSVRAHEEWTMPHIYRELLRLKVLPSVIFIPAGTTSLLVSTRALRNYFPKLRSVGAVCVNDEQKVPGARTEKGLGVTGFGYENVIDYPLVRVGKKEAFAMSRELVRHYVTGGPTSGMAVAGFCEFLMRLYKKGGMKALRPLMNAEGKIVCIFIFMDTHLTYLPEYEAVLGKNV